MKTALESLPTIGTVNISRVAVDPVRPRNGLRWTISFLTNVGDIQTLLVSTDDGETYAKSAGGNQLTGTNTRVNSITSVVGLKGFDQQTILTSSAANDLTGTFNVAIDGKSTGPLAHDITAEKMKKHLKIWPCWLYSGIQRKCWKWISLDT